MLETCFTRLAAWLKSLGFVSPSRLGKHSALQGPDLQASHLELPEWDCNLIWRSPNTTEVETTWRMERAYKKQVHLLLPQRWIWSEGSEYNFILFQIFSLYSSPLQASLWALLWIGSLAAANSIHACIKLPIPSSSSTLLYSEFPITDSPYSGTGTQTVKQRTNNNF